MIYWLLIFQVVLTWRRSLPSLNDNICLPAGKMENINKRYIKKKKASADEQRGAGKPDQAAEYNRSLLRLQDHRGLAAFRMRSRIIIATVNILLVGVKWDIKAINHCLSVLISVQEIRGIGSHKSWPGDSTLRLHSSWRYRFIVLKTHSGE